MKRNSFKELEDIELQGVSMNTDTIKNGISSDMGFLRFLTSTVELYFPRVIDLFIGMAGGNPEGDNSRGPKSKYPDM